MLPSTGEDKQISLAPESLQADSGSKAASTRLLEQLEQLELESSNGEAWADLEEMYEALPEDGFVADNAFDADNGRDLNLELMETHARGRSYLARLVEEREAHADRMLEEAKRRIGLYRERAIDPVVRGVRWHEQCLGRLLALSGQRRVDLVHGRVEFTARREDLQKEDDHRFDDLIVAWLRKHGHDAAVRRKIEEAPDMRSVKKLWRTQGVVPPHTRVVTVGGNLKVTAPDAGAGGTGQALEGAAGGQGTGAGNGAGR